MTDVRCEQAYQQVIAEAGHLLEGEKAFLDVAAPASGPSTAVQDQVLALLDFISSGLATKHMQGKIDAARAAGNDNVDTDLAGLVRALLDLSAPPTSTYSAQDKAELAEAAGLGVTAAVHLMSVKSFSDSITWLLDLADPSIESRALELLRLRLPQIKPARRADISPAVLTVVDRIRPSLTARGAESESALATLDTIASSVFAAEDGALSKTIPDLMAIAHDKTSAAVARWTALGVITKLMCVDCRPSYISWLTCLPPAIVWALDSFRSFRSSFPSLWMCSSEKLEVG